MITCSLEINNLLYPLEQCSFELKRIKAGDTPCPLDTMEGLLL